MTEKRIGYSLLALGIFVMFCAFIFILLVFTGQRDPVAVVSLPAPKIDLSGMLAGSLPPGAPPLPKTEIEVIPTLQFNKILNMSISLLLSGFVMSFGFKIASLGVMFIRTIQVNLKQSNSQSPQ